MEGPMSKKARKKISCSSKNDEDTLNLDSYLTYDILRLIFQYLDAKNLANAAMVCRSWLEAVNNEKHTRSPCCYMQKTFNQIHDVLSYIQNIRIKPSITFMFAPEDSTQKFKELTELLPGQCVMLHSKGSIMNNREMEYSPNVVCAFLPQIPNVKIKTLIINRKTIKKTCKNIFNTISKYKYEASTSNHETSTCLMLFSNDCNDTIANIWASIIQKSEEKNIFSVWGGIVAHISMKYGCYEYKNLHEKSRVRSKSEPNCVAVLISGAIKTWSMIIDKQCNTIKQVETRLELFKDKIKLQKHSIAFMFVCIARGETMYKEANVESTIFKRLFPKVPLVGCFGYGEFGKTSFTENDKRKPNDEYTTPWYNEFSTVFLILTYG